MAREAGGVASSPVVPGTAEGGNKSSQAIPAPPIKTIRSPADKPEAFCGGVADASSAALSSCTPGYLRVSPSSHSPLIFLNRSSVNSLLSCVNRASITQPSVILCEYDQYHPRPLPYMNRTSTIQPSAITVQNQYHTALCHHCTEPVSYSPVIIVQNQYHTANTKT